MKIAQNSEICDVCILWDLRCVLSGEVRRDSSLCIRTPGGGYFIKFLCAIVTKQHVVMWSVWILKHVYIVQLSPLIAIFVQQQIYLICLMPPIEWFCEFLVIMKSFHQLVSIPRDITGLFQDSDQKNVQLKYIFKKFTDSTI